MVDIGGVPEMAGGDRPLLQEGRLPARRSRCNRQSKINQRHFTGSVLATRNMFTYNYYKPETATGFCTNLRPAEECSQATP